MLLDAHQAEPAGWGPPPVTSSRVHTVGYLEEDVLRAVATGATALVLPSREEGFGLPLAEALATGGCRWCARTCPRCARSPVDKELAVRCLMGEIFSGRDR